MLKIVRKLNICTVIALLVLSATSAQADVLFQQPSDNYAAYDSTFTVGAFLADDFSIPSGGTITGVQWTGGYPGLPPTDNFGLVFRSDNNGLPGAILASYSIGSAAVRTDTGTQFVAFPSRDIYSYQYTLPSPFTAVAGTTYFVGIGNSYTSGWGWAESDKTGFVALSVDYPQSGVWFSTTLGNRAFQLDGTTSSVPEPTTMLLLGLGLMGLAGVRRKFKE